MSIKNITGVFDIYKESTDAELRIRPYIRETAAEYSDYFSDAGNCDVYLKLENTQLTGSFKLRGAFNRLLTLTVEERKKRIITASTGNHAAAVTFAMRKLGMKGTIFVPESIAASKLEILKTGRADLEYHGDDAGITESFARKFAVDNNLPFISPYNDLKVIGGQGTVGAELNRQIEKIDAVFVPVGGGGLASGISGYLKSIKKNIEIVGCQPENSCVMNESIKAGKIVEKRSFPTLSDGTAGGIEDGSMTFIICRECVDDFVLVSEDEIKHAIMLVLKKFHMLIEGAAALSVAAFLKTKERFADKSVVLIISGKKIGFDTLRKIICKD